jgi:ubiquitin-protein ligase
MGSVMSWLCVSLIILVRWMLMRHRLQTIKCLLIVPNPESALDEEAGKLLLEDYQEYYKVRQHNESSRQSAYPIDKSREQSL